MSALTYVEKFNFYLKSFIDELVTVYPEYKDSLESEYKILYSEEKSNTDEFVKEYISVTKQYNSSIAKKDDSIFKGLNEINILRKIDFRDLWSKDINNNTRESIWKYLQTLIVIGRKVIGDDDEINDLLRKFNESDGEKLGESVQRETEEMMNMLKNMTEMNQDPDSIPESEDDNEMKNLFEGGIISDIAKELTGELDLENMDIGEPKNMNDAFNNIMGGGNNNFFNLINKVGEKIQNKVQSGEINQNDLMNEATKMMGGLKNPDKMAKILKNQQKKTGGDTRERLKRKLEERKAKAQEAQNQLKQNQQN